MNKIKDILTINLDDEIKSVIDLHAQSDREIISELDGFILTESLAKHLSDFCDEYVSGQMQSGVWLSGFYGSGKSYFAKMLGYLLRNPMLEGTTFRQRFVPKLTGLPDVDVLENNIRGLDRINSLVVLFDSAKSTNTYGLPYMLMANFLHALGLLDNWIGLLEYELLLDGRYDEFLQIVQKNEGASWLEVRKSMKNSPSVFKRALSDLGMSAEEIEESKNLVTQHRAEYDAAKLREDLQRYLDKNPDKRIVFMIDEVSEAINQDKINLLDLEGIAESLASLGRKAWTIAIAQLKLDDVISMKNVSKNLLTKLRDRFRTTIDIKADEVDVIIKQRLLAKYDDAREELKDYYNHNSGAIRDITNLPGLNLRPTQDADTYADYYPFHEYQFRMLQYFLFGSGQMVQTKTGARGMIISAFDVLKKEVKRDYHEHAHVTATQLCKQAELTTEEEQRARYEQATNALRDKGYQYVEGTKLLQTIHFLAKTEVTQTTAENICKAYIDCPDLYYKVLAEVKSALTVLVENQIVLLAGNQYRITNQTEQRILDDMKAYDVPPFVIRNEVTRCLKGLSLLRSVQTINVESVPVNFLIAREDGEPVIGNNGELLKVMLHDIFVVRQSGDTTQYINVVKQDSQQHKEAIYIVPDIADANEITSLVTDIKRIEYINEKSYLTEEEKRIVLGFTAELETKKDRLTELLRTAYASGSAIYAYQVYQLSEPQFTGTLRDLQARLYDNIFTKRLSAKLPDTLAPKVLTEPSNRLHALFGTADDFKFFDTKGNFVGTNLSVSIEILAKAASFISGAELEKQLSAPPTGYSIGTIMCAVVALFRGNKLIAKYAGQDFNSVNTEGCRDIFQSTRNFAKASFKAVAQNLTYKERTEIIDILKEDCNYKQWTGDNLSFQMNDFDVVDAVRSLSKAILSKVNQEIALDDRMSRLFAGSIQTKAVFQPFTIAVNEATCFSQARAFLSQQDEFVKAVERVEQDLDFIKTKFRDINNIKYYLADVKEEIIQAECDRQLIDPIVEKFTLCYETNVVSNYKTIQQLSQQARDVYYALFNGKKEVVSKLYNDLRIQAEQLKTQLDAYPKEWNAALYSNIAEFDSSCKRYEITLVDIPQYEIRCRKCGFQLRDLTYAENMAPQQEQKLLLWQTEIVTSQPTPPQPQPQPNPEGGQPQPQPQPQPKTRAMRSHLPQGKMSVSDYRQWLTQQMLLIKNFNSNDELDFNN